MEPKLNPDPTGPTQPEHACTIGGCDCKEFVADDKNFMFCGNCKHKKTEHGPEYRREVDAAWPHRQAQQPAFRLGRRS
jgi:hypothetical protein